MQPPTKTRLKASLKWIGIVLGALTAILLIANAWCVWSTNTQLENRLAAIRDAGQPVSLADLAREPIPPEKNAVTYLRRAESDVTAIVNELVNNEANEFPGRLISSDGQKAIQATLEAYPKVIALIDQAAACPVYDAQFDFNLPADEFVSELLERQSGNSNFGRVLRLRSLLLASSGKCDESLRTSIVILQLARHFDHNPALVSYLQSLGIRNYAIDAVNVALQTGSVSTEVHKALDAELALQERMEGYAAVFESERALGIDFFRTFPDRNFWLVGRAMWNYRELSYLDAMQGIIELTHDSASYQQADQRFKVLLAKPATQQDVFAQIIVPSFQQAHEAVARTKARIRALRILNALLSRHQETGDSIPKLTELGLPAETIADPYTGDPLHLKKASGGWLIYSVGKNFQDDGGKLDDKASDVGVGPIALAAKPAELNSAVSPP